MSVDEKNKKPKKPAVKQDEDFIEEDDNKSLILLAVGIILVIGLMIGVITYLNKSDEPKGKDNEENKQNEVVDPEKEENKEKQKEEKDETSEDVLVEPVSNVSHTSAVVSQQSAPVVTTKYTVNYYEGQNIINSLTVESGKNIPFVYLTLSSNQRLKHWYYVDGNGNEVAFNFNTDTVTSNLDLYPKIVDLFTVDFVYGSNPDIAVTDSQTVENLGVLETLDENDLITTNGQGDYEKVVGWYRDPNFGNQFDLTTPITESLTLYAKVSSAYEVVFYKEYRADYENYVGSLETKIVEENSKVEKLEGLVSGDKVLKEWHELIAPAIQGGTYTTQLYDFETLVTEKKTLVPIFGYTLTYNTDGGSEIEPVVIEEGELLIEPTAPTKTGYKFKEWTDESGSTVDFRTATMTDNTTIKAIWDVLVTFEANGGNIGGNTVIDPIVPDADGKVTINDPAKAGYEFVGWYEDSTFSGNKVDLSTATFTAPKTLYAKWNAIENTITFNLNGGTNTVNAGVNVTQKATTDSSVTLLDLTGTYTFDGHVLLGYSTTAQGDVVYTLGQTITMGTTDMTLYAVWGELHTLTVDFNTGTNATGQSTSTKDLLKGDKILDDIESLTVGAQSADGSQVITGYNTQSDGLGTAIDANTEMPDSDYTIYVIWGNATP